MVPGRGDSGGVDLLPRRSLVADDTEFQTMIAMLALVSDAVRTLVDWDRMGAEPVPSTARESESAANVDSSSASRIFLRGESVTNFIDDSEKLRMLAVRGAWTR